MSPSSHRVNVSPPGHKVAVAVPAPHRNQHTQKERGHVLQEFFLEEEKVFPQVSPQGPFLNQSLLRGVRYLDSPTGLGGACKAQDC